MLRENHSSSCGCLDLVHALCLAEFLVALMAQCSHDIPQRSGLVIALLLSKQSMSSKPLPFLNTDACFICPVKDQVRSFAA